MRDTQKDLDIAKNIKLIEWLKTELLENVSGLFRGFQQGSEGLLKEGLANIVILSYLLARRIGMRYSQVDELILEKINRNLNDAQEPEHWQADLNILENHFKNRR